jgi:simple sugar transport system ATP-binding protein
MALDPHAPVWQLSVGEQQRVEILKALYRGARILILDEPTAVLSPRESAALRAALRQMAGRGQAVIFISHKLDEVLQVADRITVLRRGRVTAAGLAAAQATRASLAEEMVGRPVLLDLDRPPAAPGDPVLEVQDLCARGDRGGDAVRGVSLRVRAGEIYGLAGVAGNGQRELMEVLTGLRPAARGQVRLAGRDVTAAPPAVRLDLGLAHVPEDRGGLGSVPALSVADNLVLRAYRREGALLDRRRLGQTVQDLRAAFALAAPPEAPAGTLSGGSLQRLILARELSARPRLLIAHCPCRGLDVAASETVYRWLLQARAQGTAILLISEDLDELLSLSDRIGVMSGGALRGELAAAGASSGELGLLIGAG